MSPNQINDDTTKYKCPKYNIRKIYICAFRKINCKYFKVIYPDLEVMRLNNNNITELNEDLFTSLPNMILIDLRNNQIKSIPYNLFINNNKLFNIYLTNNKIKIFIVELAHILNLNSLFLSKNPIETLHEGTLKKFLIGNTNRTKQMGVSLINSFKCDCNVNWIRRIKKDITMIDIEFENEDIYLTEFLKEYEHLANNCTLNNIIVTNLIG